MSEPRILTPTDRARIRDLWLIDDYDTADVAALLDTCDAMQAALCQIVANGGGGCRTFRGPHTCRDDETRSPDATYGADQWCDACIALAVLDTTRQDRTDG